MGQCIKSTAKTAGVVDIGTLNDELFNASKRGDSEKIAELLEWGAHPLYQGTDSELSCVHVARSPKVLVQLLTCQRMKKNTVDIDDIRDFMGNTPLHIACRSGRLQTALALVEMGATLGCLNKAGKTAAEVAEVFMHDDTSHVLKQLETGQCWCDIDTEVMLQLYFHVYSFRDECVQIYEHIDYEKKKDARERKLAAKDKEARERKLLKQAMEEKKQQETTQDRAEFELQETLRMINAIGETLDAEKTEEGAEVDGQADPAPVDNETTAELLLGDDKNIDDDEEEDWSARYRLHEPKYPHPADITKLIDSIRMPALAFHLRSGSGCPGRTCVCPRCSEVVSVAQRMKHEHELCEYAPVPCPNKCGELVARRDLDSHLPVCMARPWVICPNEGCGVNVKREELSLHMRLKCPKRLRRCRHCRERIRADAYEHHQDHVCQDRRVKCGVPGCDQWFRLKTDRRKMDHHERMHLQKRMNDWTPAEVGFWFRKTFPFFGKTSLARYTHRAENNKVSGARIRSCAEPKELRHLLMHVCGMTEDHAMSAMEGMGIPAFLQSQDICEHKKPLRAGAFLDPRVKRTGGEMSTAKAASAALAAGLRRARHQQRRDKRYAVRRTLRGGTAHPASFHVY